jgi:hypothetical protein
MLCSLTIVRPFAGYLPIKYVSYFFNSNQIKKPFYAFFIPIIQYSFDKHIDADIYLFFRFYPPELRAVFLDKFVNLRIMFHGYALKIFPYLRNFNYDFLVGDRIILPIFFLLYV